jgi:uncharacterized protein YggE
MAFFASAVIAANASGAAQSPMTGNPGEIGLEIYAQGTVRSAPTSITLNVSIQTTSILSAVPTDQEKASATAKHRQQTDRLLEVLKAKGVSGSAVTEMHMDERQMGFVGNEFANGPITVDISAPRPQMGGPAQPRMICISRYQIRLNGNAQLDEIRKVLSAAGATINGPPQLALKDDLEARRSAIASAIAKARADADIYASSLGMRVLRISGVSNQSPGLTNDPYREIFSNVLAQQAGTPTEVVTQAETTIDFVIGPR